MREILFRGKSKATGVWRMGWYQPDFEYKWELTERDARHSDAAICFLNYDTRPDWSYVDVNTVGQFTGLTDKNGTKIFEGDIVKIRLLAAKMEWKGVCEYRNGAFGLAWQYAGERYCTFAGTCNAEYEVLGNIHDNPEMMEDE